MATQRKTSKKRGRKEQRPAITEHPFLLGPSETRALKAEFDAAHADGMASLERGDYDNFGKAIEAERKIVEQLVPQPTSPPKHCR